MKLEHTPGPWKYEITDATPNRLDIIIKSGEEPIGWFYTIPDEGEANTRLAVAAPKMLDDMIWFVKRCRTGEVQSVKTQARFIKTIESATGKTIEELLS